MTTTPEVWYVLTWAGFANWYFGYWNKYPRLSPFFWAAGTGLLASVVKHRIGV